MKPTLLPPLAVTVPTLAAVALLAALSAPFALAQSADGRPDPARGEARGAGQDIQNGNTGSAQLLLPAVQKARDAARRQRGGVNVATGDINGDAAASSGCDTVQSDIAELRANGGATVCAGAGPQDPSSPRRPSLQTRRQGGDQ
jgi:hypothetical protein